MIKHQELKTRDVLRLIKNQSITFAGNARLKIYGKLDCASGKRMKTENRVFFKTEMEAIQAGFRPCGHCLYVHYSKWKQDF